jgi:hypothetical protein
MGLRDDDETPVTIPPGVFVYGPPRGVSVTSAWGVTPEGQLRGGTRGTHSAVGAPAPRPADWNGRVWEVSEGGFDPDGRRYKLVCVGRRHRFEKTVTRNHLAAAYNRAVTANRRTISLLEL